jgi:hypothetical protein
VAVVRVGLQSRTRCQKPWQWKHWVDLVHVATRCLVERQLKHFREKAAGCGERRQGLARELCSVLTAFAAGALATHLDEAVGIGLRWAGLMLGADDDRADATGGTGLRPLGKIAYDSVASGSQGELHGGPQGGHGPARCGQDETRHVARGGRGPSWGSGKMRS